MKKKLLLAVAWTVAMTSRSSGQDWNHSYTLNFEDTVNLYHLIIDSTVNHSNLWQVGMPNKTFFTNAHSLPEAIVTDTLNSYPVNDTSTFEILNIAGLGWQVPHTVALSGYYQVNSDTLTDYGKIEISPDNGMTWIDLINDTSYSAYYEWYLTIPVLSGNSNGWQHFEVYLEHLGPLFNVQLGDTVLFRFIFISDSIQTSKDGLMFDDFLFVDFYEGIQEIENENLISISPNPVDETLFVQKTQNTNSEAIQIFDYSGKIVFENPGFYGQIVDTRQLNDGIYLLKYSDGKNYSMKKIVVEH